MASGGDGSVCGGETTLQVNRPQERIKRVPGDSANVPTSRVLTDILESENRDEEDEFVRVFTSQPLPTVSSSYGSGHDGFDCSDDSRTATDYYRHDSEIQTQCVSDYDAALIDKLDNELHELPKDIYIGKLLDICVHNENHVCWYRDILCSRARQQTGCPSGKLMNRKTTNNSPRIIKFARDCYALYTFIQGDKSGVEQVFDKQKPHSSVADPAKINSVEFNVSLQSLSQRLAELEEAISTRDKTIASLNTELRDLRSYHDELRLEYECFKAETDSKLSKCQSFQKLSSDRLKRIDSEQNQFHLRIGKSDDEIKRLTKVNANFQKQVNSLSPLKSYASTLATGKPEMMISSSPVRQNKRSTSPSASNLTSSNRIHSQTTPTHLITDVEKLNHTETVEMRNNSSVSKPSDSKTLKTQPHREPQEVSSAADVSLHSVHLNDSVQSSDKNVFRGVNRKRNARYFLSGIDRESTRDGIFKYLETKGVKVSHMVVFKPRSTRSQLTAKINVPLDQADRIETPNFWPSGVRCRKWFSNRDWEARWNTDEHEEYKSDSRSDKPREMRDRDPRSHSRSTRNTYCD